MACAITGSIALSTSYNGVAQSKKEEILLQQTSEVNNLMVQYNADRGSLSRFYAVPYSPEKRERFVQFQQEYLRKLEALPFDQFSTGSRVDYILFKRNLDNQLRMLAAEAKGYAAISRFIPFAPAIYDLEKQRRRGISQDGKKLAADMFQWQQQIRQSMQQLQQEPEMDMALAEMASGAARGLQQALRSVFDFYYGYDPGFTWWVDKPYRTTDSLLNAYSGQLKLKGKITTTQKDDGSGIIGKPIGREELIRQLQYEMIPYTPEDLIAMANKEFAWCDQEMLKASQEMGFGDDWKKAMEVVKNSYVPEGKQPELILRLFNESVDFLKKHDLVTIPPLAEETWRMTMMSPQQQLVSPFFLGGEAILIAYPTNTMEEDDKLMSMRGNNPHFSRAVVHHELIAGHHLQGFMGNRFKAYREFDTPFWTEGWSLYQEFILWDLKFPRSAADRIGMLFWRMHRCARIIFSLNYHLGNWTPQQCIDFLVERVNHERANAAGEVRRSFTGGYGPLYQLAYMVGGQQFYALKKELVDTGKMSYKEFHDAILRENGMPVEMVRAILIQQPLKKDFVTGWKFYGK
ncbi:MAG: DUF885 family protein [Chitinophagaceae bacterium]|nr:DUF885 family protein [Chitinophagaceae bacterium]